MEEFIGIKSYKAKGKRLSTREIDSWEFLEPFQPEPTEETPEEAPEEVTEKIQVNPDDIPLEIVEPKGDGVQMDLFGDEL